MKNKISRQLTYWLGVIAIGLVVGLGVQFVRAWTEPSVAPPGGNVGAPVNTSGIAQTKSGDLTAQNLTSNLDVLANDNLVSINVATMLSQLDVGPGVTSPFRVTSSGNISRIRGLPYTWPNVQGVAGQVLTNNGSGGLSWTTVSGSGGFWTQTGSYLYPNDTNWNVGIGTASPTSGKLHVSGGNLFLTNSDTWGVSMIVNNTSGNNTWRFVAGGATGDGNVPAGGMAIHHDTQNSPIQIKNDGTIFMNAGNVGIGTAGPIRALQINGELSLSRADKTGFINISDVNGNGGGTIWLRGLTNNGSAQTDATVLVSGNVGISGNIEAVGQICLDNGCSSVWPSGGGVSNPSKDCGGGNAIQSFNVNSGAQGCISVPQGLVGIQNCHTYSSSLQQPPVGGYITVNCDFGLAVSGGFDRAGSTIVTAVDSGPIPGANGWRCGGGGYNMATGYCRVRCCQ